jgi:hypothetical protein
MHVLEKRHFLSLAEKGTLTAAVVRLAVERQDEGCGWNYLGCQMGYCQRKTHFLS